MRENVTTDFGTIPGSWDGSAHLQFSAGAAYPTECFAKTRDHEFMNPEEAHRHSSIQPAIRGAFKDRGRLREELPVNPITHESGNVTVKPVETVRHLPGGECRVGNRGPRDIARL
jgi:hypothetical protein